VLADGREQREQFGLAARERVTERGCEAFSGPNPKAIAIDAKLEAVATKLL